MVELQSDVDEAVDAPAGSLSRSTDAINAVVLTVFQCSISSYT
ncbi:hypothetical protein [Mycolicibacterium sp.]